MNNSKALLLIALVAVATAAVSMALPLNVYAGDVNPAHDANNGGGNEKSLGTCKQEANNDNSCKAKFP